MKKLLCVLFATIILLISGCSGFGETPDALPSPTASSQVTEAPEKPKPTPHAEAEESPEPTPAPTPAPAPTPTPTPVPTPEVTPGVRESANIEYEQCGDTAIVQHNITPINPGATFTGLAALEQHSYTVTDPANSRALSTAAVEFSFGAAADGKPHWITQDNQKTFDALGKNALAWDNKSGGNILYLTFDCGYEYGTLTSDILDILSEKAVPAAFFVTMDYLEDAPTVVTRMINEGHIVGNHSTTHPNCANLSREELAWDLLGVENYLRANFGYSSKYFRFPSGTYSENALDLCASMGLRSAFWSIAHADWDPENQPGVDVSFNTVTSRLHPGAVILLHSTSPDNVAILADFIDYCRNLGYEFKTLDDYAYWNS